MPPPPGHELSDSEPDEAFDSPIKRSTSFRDQNRPKTPNNQSSRYDEQDKDDARETVLRRELEGVRNINELIEGVVGTLERAKGNMATVSKTVDTASALLNTWTRILSQTEHNQRLILNPTWKGASADVAEKQGDERRKHRTTLTGSERAPDRLAELD
ncbi:DASH complex subunit Duo1-domain-containing protein [Microdochium trichocladiopsis]|uniref:DASH complex subunit DUO1 n=1 Tax=Microdochium trichocladiopsis TaxID=1682393 RepID=A0A9P8XW55_9PEZI|nr:DASH complex subunit Duo1-domain-containing protein [Microdochium trichocladiopsis]KAH7021037.1 DASH complex subunit Duo1-domain-containing protein [Microdochium trichocladiopsis]